MQKYFPSHEVMVEERSNGWSTSFIGKYPLVSIYIYNNYFVAYTFRLVLNSYYPKFGSYSFTYSCTLTLIILSRV
jgi:hypothetical protein